jgi:signal transduction histidine kinase
MCGQSDCPMKQILRGETRVECTVDKRRPDGTVIPCILNASPFLGPDGECVGIVESFRDITVIKRAEQLAALGEVAAGVAHEINNPINGIINYAQILVNRNQGEGPTPEIPRRIIKEGERIARIVEGLLAFARREIDVKMPVALQDIIAESMALTGAQMRRDGIILRCETPVELPPVQACPRQIEQVFINILSNARHALNQRYPEVHENKLLEVAAGTKCMEGRPFVVVSFLDRGVGIPAGVIGQITSPFFSTKTDEKSTGLGLSISQGILQDHGGRLMFDSVEGEFTRVDVALPVWREKGEMPQGKSHHHE